MTEKQRDSAQLLASFLEVMRLMFMNYPVLAPLLGELRQNLREGLAQAAEVLPKIAEILQGIEVDGEVTERVTNQLLEAVPELRKFFPRTEE